MATHRVVFHLTAHHPDGASVRADEFVAAIGAEVGGCVAEVLADRGRWATSRVSFVPVVLGEGEERHDRLAAELLVRSDEVAAWIDTRADVLRGLGPKLGFVVAAWITQDQLDWAATPALLAALGRAGVGLVLTTEGPTAG